MNEIKPEDPRNVGFVHKDCAPTAQAKYSNLSPDLFVGKFIKTAFEGVDPHGVKRNEHIWVLVTKTNDDGSLHGTIENDAVLQGVPGYGTPVDVERNNISQVLPEIQEGDG